MQNNVHKNARSMGHRFGILFAGVACSLVPALASATPVMESLSQNQTTTGQVLTYNFSGLPASDGADGFVTVASAAGSDFDLSTASTEYFDLALDGNAAGRYSCNTTSGGATVMSSCNNDASNNTFNEQFSFSGLLADFGIDMPTLLSDGLLAVTVDFGPGVNPGFTSLNDPNPNTLTVTLDYTSTVPAPATIALLGLGLLGAAVKNRALHRIA